MAHKVDCHVGQRLRQCRWMLGATQPQVAAKIGVQFQQLQKYETGANRVSASRLWELSQALEVPISYFFEGLEGAHANSGDVQGDPHSDRKALALVRAYHAMPKPHRRQLLDLARVLAVANPVSFGETRTAAA